MSAKGEFLPYITCNTCGQLKSDNVRIFFTNCKHLFCKSCLQQQQARAQCQVCKVPAKFVEVGPSMPPHVKKFLQPLGENVQDVPVQVFQLGLQRIYLTQREGLAEKYESVKKEIRKKIVQKRRVKERICEEKRLIAKLDQALAERGEYSGDLTQSFESLSTVSGDKSVGSDFTFDSVNEPSTSSARGSPAQARPAPAPAKPSPAQARPAPAPARRSPAQARPAPAPAPTRPPVLPQGFRPMLPANLPRPPQGPRAPTRFAFFSTNAAQPPRQTPPAPGVQFPNAHRKPGGSNGPAGSKPPFAVGRRNR